MLGVVLATAAAALLVLTSGSAPSTATAATSTWCGGRGKIVILGDSLATGFGTTGYDTANGNGYQPTTYGWPSRWDARSGTTIVNLARNGAMASDFITDGVQSRPGGPFVPTAVQQIKSARPDLVVIQLGGNEFISDRDPAKTYEVNLRRLAWRVKQAAPNAKLLFVHTYAFDYRDPSAAPYDFTWGQYGAAMRAVAAGQWYMDLTEYMPSTRFNSAGLYLRDEYGPNLAVHATDAGHIALFSAYWSKVQCR